MPAGVKQSFENIRSNLSILAELYGGIDNLPEVEREWFLDLLSRLEKDTDRLIPAIEYSLNSN